VSGWLDKIIGRSVARSPEARAEAEAVGREIELERVESPEAAEYRAFLERIDAGAVQKSDESPWEALARLDEDLEREEDRVEAEIRHWYEARARHGVAGGRRARLILLERQRDELEAARAKVFPVVNPPSFNGQVNELAALRCRQTKNGCRSIFRSKREYNELHGLCRRCRQPAVEAPSQLDQLLEQIP
jgi:hypothetical protein